MLDKNKLQNDIIAVENPFYKCVFREVTNEVEDASSQCGHPDFNRN